MSRPFFTLEEAINTSVKMVKDYGADVDTGHWQGIPTQGSPDLVTRELIDWDFAVPSLEVGMRTIPKSSESILDYWRMQVKPNLPWADDHFEERVSRVPSNPGKEYMNWPWWHGQVSHTTARSHMDPDHKEFAPANFRFDHTYQERFWPKFAGLEFTDEHPSDHLGGIRYPYGDLDDVVNLLLREPYTRQAYFPIYFPEDTGSVHGGRIPCTLGYHFMLRNGELHLWYTIRSCDVVRHFRDDVYFALRLLDWVLSELKEQESPHTSPGKTPPYWADVRPGRFHFKAFSFHYHKGDEHHLA